MESNGTNSNVSRPLKIDYNQVNDPKSGKMLVSQSLLFSVFCIWFGCAQTNPRAYLNEFNYWELLDCYCGKSVS